MMHLQLWSFCAFRSVGIVPQGRLLKSLQKKGWHIAVSGEERQHLEGSARERAPALWALLALQEPLNRVP